MFCLVFFLCVREKIFRFFEERPDLQTPVEIAKDAHRELAYKQLLALVRDCGVRPMQLLMKDPARYFTVVEAVGFIDISLGIKMGVQFRFSIPKQTWRITSVSFK